MKADLYEDISRLMFESRLGEHLSRAVPRYEKLYDLYKGKHEINHRTVGKNKPNNRLSADFYGKLIDTEIGYFLGRPIVFNSENNEALDNLGTILVNNEFDELIMEVGKEASIKGKSYMMIYQDEDSETKLCRLSPESVFTFESKRGRGEIGVAVRIYEEVDEYENTHIYLEVYDKEHIHYLDFTSGVLGVDKRYEVNPVSHIFPGVPIIEVKNNEEEMGSFEKVISLVEAYDLLLSDTSNEHEAYRNAYLLLKNLTADSDTMDKLRDSGIIEVYDDGDAKFLSKPILDSAIESHLNRLATDIHRFADIPDLSDENFAGNLSGVAIRFKLLGLENKCIIKERKMTKAIRRMVRLLNGVLAVKDGGEVIDVTKLQLIFNRNIPNNLTEIVDTVVKLDGMVDKDTLLSLLPFVESPQEVIEKLEREKDNYANDVERYANANFIQDTEDEATEQRFGQFSKDDEELEVI